MSRRGLESRVRVSAGISGHSALGYMGYVVASINKELQNRTLHIMRPIIGTRQKGALPSRNQNTRWIPMFGAAHMGFL